MNLIVRVLVPISLQLLSQSALADLVQKTTTQVVESPDITMSLLKVTGGLLLVIIAILGSAWAYRRFGNLTPVASDDLRVIGGVSMGSKERIVLMQVGEEQILLGVSPGRIQRLHVLNKNIEIDSQESTTNKPFSSQLNLALKQWKCK